MASADDEIDPYFSVNLEGESEINISENGNSVWKEVKTLLRSSFSSNKIEVPKVTENDSSTVTPVKQNVELLSSDVEIYDTLGLNLEKRFRFGSISKADDPEESGQIKMEPVLGDQSELDTNYIAEVEATLSSRSVVVRPAPMVDFSSDSETENEFSTIGAEHKTHRDVWVGGENLSTNKLSMMLSDMHGRLKDGDAGLTPRGTRLITVARSGEGEELAALLSLGSCSPYGRPVTIGHRVLPSYTVPSEQRSVSPPHDISVESAAIVEPNLEVKSIRRGGKITKPGDNDDSSVTSTISASSTISRNRTSLPLRTSSSSLRGNQLTAENIAKANAAVNSFSNKHNGSSNVTKGPVTTPVKVVGNAPPSSTRGRSTTPTSLSQTSRPTRSVTPTTLTRSTTPSGTTPRSSLGTSTTQSRLMQSTASSATPSVRKSLDGALNKNTPTRPASSVGGSNSRSTTPSTTTRSPLPSKSSTLPTSRSTTPTSTPARSVLPTNTSRATTPTNIPRPSTSNNSTSSNSHNGNSSSNRSTTPTSLKTTSGSAQTRSTTPNGVKTTSGSSTAASNRSTTPTGLRATSSSISATPNRSTTPTSLSRTSTSNGTGTSSRPTTPTNIPRVKKADEPALDVTAPSSSRNKPSLVSDPKLQKSRISSNSSVSSSTTSISGSSRRASLPAPSSGSKTNSGGTPSGRNSLDSARRPSNGGVSSSSSVSSVTSGASSLGSSVKKPLPATGSRMSTVVASSSNISSSASTTPTKPSSSNTASPNPVHKTPPSLLTHTRSSQNMSAAVAILKKMSGPDAFAAKDVGSGSASSGGDSAFESLETGGGAALLPAAVPVLITSTVQYMPSLKHSSQIAINAMYASASAAHNINSNSSKIQAPVVVTQAETALQSAVEKQSEPEPERSISPSKVTLQLTKRPSLGGETLSPKLPGDSILKKESLVGNRKPSFKSERLKVAVTEPSSSPVPINGNGYAVTHGKTYQSVAEVNSITAALKELSKSVHLSSQQPVRRVNSHSSSQSSIASQSPRSNSRKTSFESSIARTPSQELEPVPPMGLESTSVDSADDMAVLVDEDSLFK